MFCRWCGNRIENNGSSCPTCGKNQGSLVNGNGFWDLVEGPKIVNDLPPVEPMVYKTPNTINDVDIRCEELEQKTTRKKNNNEFVLLVLIVLILILLISLIVSLFLLKNNDTDADRVLVTTEDISIKESTENITVSVEDITSENTTTSEKVETTENSSSTDEDGETSESSDTSNNWDFGNLF